MDEFPSNITFQWHVTDKCNLRCAHCYQEAYADDGISFEKNLEILKNLESFVKTGKKAGGLKTAHINFTGGEPFFKQGIMELLKATEKTKCFRYGILSNGYLLPESELVELSKLKLEFVQISVEGGKDLNDQIRGKGTYNKIKAALQAYKKLKIPVMLSFTANSTNFREFSKVVKLGRSYKVTKVWSDRYLPNGVNDRLELNPEQFREFNHILSVEKDKIQRKIFPGTKVATNRALQFLCSGGAPYQCSAGKTLLAILPNGDIYPCRRLPVRLGNIFTNNLRELYADNKVLKELRDVSRLDPKCKNCFYSKSCNGGLKCLSYIKYGNFHRKDPGCWI